MNDYMIALLDRFKVRSSRTDDLAQRIIAAETELKETMNKDQRRLLLRMTDLTNVQREEAELYGFISGYRAASGILGELNQYPVFSAEHTDAATE